VWLKFIFIFIFLTLFLILLETQLLFVMLVCCFCQSERSEILQALSRRMTLADDVNLDTVAAACEFFTGADLKALLYNSQLSVINETDALLATGSRISDAGFLLLLK